MSTGYADSLACVFSGCNNASCIAFIKSFNKNSWVRFIKNSKTLFSIFMWYAFVHCEMNILHQRAVICSSLVVCETRTDSWSVHIGTRSVILIIMSHFPFRVCSNKWAAKYRKECRKFDVLWNVSETGQLYYSSQGMNLTSRTVITSPYISPVPSEMKICQFMYWHDRNPPPLGSAAHCHGSSADIYQLCFWRNGAFDIRPTPPPQFAPCRTGWHKWSISTTWTNFTNR
jgi:hypothetical protein